eukprot:c27912_g1_i1 orf=100-621(-)
MRATIHIGEVRAPSIYEVSAEKRHLLFAVQHKSEGAPMVPRNSCANPPAGVLCQPTTSTVVVLVSGMCVMVLLVAIAVMLLLCSHLNYIHQRQRQQRARRSNENATNNDSPGPNTCDGMVMVLLPGEKDRLTFARPCPLQGEMCPMHAEASAVSNELKTMESFFSDSADMHGH